MNDRNSLHEMHDKSSGTKIDALLSKLIVVIDGFLPSSVRTAELDILRRGRLVVTFAWTLIVLAIVYSMVYASMGGLFCAITLSTGACVGVTGLYILRWTGSGSVAGNFITMAFYAVLTSLAVVLGGHGGPIPS